MKVINIGSVISAICFLLIAQSSHAQKEASLTGKISFEGAIVNETCNVSFEQHSIVMLCPASNSSAVRYPTTNSPVQVEAFNNEKVAFDWLDERRKIGTMIITMQ
ncbi:TPA: hypothetical protein JD264_11610 [Serratia fonticola]|nr:hypothetical protein [Serratia fonticola]